MKQITREFIACGLWVAAFVVMVFGTVESIREGHNSVVVPWAVFLAIDAHVFSVWAIVRRHHVEQEVTVERVVEIVDALHLAPPRPPRIR